MQSCCFSFGSTEAVGHTVGYISKKGHIPNFENQEWAPHTIMIHHNLTKGAMRGTPMGGTPEMHAYERHVHEMHAHEMHAHEMHAHEMHAYEKHAMRGTP